MGTSASTGAGHEAKVSKGTVLAAARFKTKANVSKMPMQSALSLRKMHQKEEKFRQRELHEKHPELKGVLDRASLGHYGLSAVTYYQDDSVWTSELGNMRSFFWDYSDASQQFAEKLARSGYLELMMRDLNAIQTGTQNNSLDESNQGTLKAIKTAISPLYNCSKLEIIKDIFRELNVVEKIKPYLKSTNTMIKAEAILIEAFIIDEQQNGLLTTDGTVFKFLIKGLKSALGAQNKRFSGFSTFELAEGLGALARNDKNKVAIVKHGALPLLTRMLASTDEEEVEQAAKTLWKLSFDQGNKVKVMEEANCFGMLQKLSRHSNEKIKKAALGALWTLKQNQTHVEEGMKATSTDSEIVSRVPQENVKSGQHIMISYNWKDQSVLLKIKDALQQLGYNVWMDVEQMSGSTLQAMAEAVEKSIVVLICISEGYKNSDNCRLEAEYAFTLRKPIIPLMMQYKYTPDGWLGALRGSKLFFDFSRDYNFNVKLQGLVKELGERGKVTGASCVAPEFFFTYLREELGIRRLRDLMKLNNALQKL
ncbi:uncharacterized protein LOC106175503 [Lingula anatina]|uniref:Uncharacterized protein LOC106175503 n=1 Tax=Lingula anatina TaxID=7574 RepID=A0A1S3JRN5_LINAN|nr:uncharacterized protein LOC106175503 [Lingula anatina]|eukprot:XP_013413002.1 uncharacterized protein LOC106175503 [Lingula anatina]